MVEFKIAPSNTGIIAQTFKKIKEITASGSIDIDTPVRILLAAGKYPGILSYNLPNPLILEGMAGTKPEDIVLLAENCEAFHKDTENRAVFVIGPNASEVTLRGFTIENTHLKSCDDASLGNQAEALCFHNQNGSLLCQNMRFISRQDTVHVKGFSRFEDCYITGDIDFIWGYCDTSVWVNCKIHKRGQPSRNQTCLCCPEPRAKFKTGIYFCGLHFYGRQKTGRKRALDWKKSGNWSKRQC